MGVLELYKYVKEHQNKVNGCWLVDIKTGNKCKVGSLTCNSAYKNNDICTATDMKGCNIEEATCKNKKPNSGVCFKQGELCMEFSNKKCTKCLTECNTGEGCKNCSCDIVPCPPGKQLHCINMNWIEALSDYVDKPIDAASKILINVIKMILLGLGIIIILYIVLSVGEYVLRKGEDIAGSIGLST